MKLQNKQDGSMMKKIRKVVASQWEEVSGKQHRGYYSGDSTIF